MSQAQRTRGVRRVFVFSRGARSGIYRKTKGSTTWWMQCVQCGARVVETGLSVTWKNEMALGPKYFLLLYNVAGFGPSQGRRYRVVQPTSHRQWLTEIESCTWGDFSETRINSNTVLEVCARRPLLSSKFDTTTADSCRQACHPLITPRFKKKKTLLARPLSESYIHIIIKGSI